MKILKKILCLLIICLFTTSFVGCSKDSEIIDENYIKTNTTSKLERVFKAINDEDYINFISELDYTMKINTTAENFKSMVKNIKDTIGEYQSSEYDSYEELDNDYITVKYKAVFSDEPDETNIVLTINKKHSDLTICGIYINSPKMNESTSEK